MQNRDIFYGKDIPKLFPKPEFWPEMSEIERVNNFDGGLQK